jgi:hypothetical protein
MGALDLGAEIPPHISIAHVRYEALRRAAIRVRLLPWCFRGRTSGARTGSDLAKCLKI